MTLLYVLLLSAAALVSAPFLVKALDRKAGWPLAALFIAAAALLVRAAPGFFNPSGATPQLIYERPWVPDFVAPDMDMNFALRVDGLSIFFALLALCIGAVVFIYSAAYLPKHVGNQSFYIIMSAFMLAVLLLVLADDVILLFIGWELVSIASFLLIARAGSGGEAGATRTLILTFVGGLTLLTALSIAATQAHSTSLAHILESDVWQQKPALTTFIAVLIAISAFTKSAQLPFHFWLPEAMAAATPVSAFLHAAAVVKAGIYLLMRFSTIFADNHTWNALLIISGMATAVMASFFAIQKTDLKQLTAYSTVSHLGWIVATIGIGTPFALAAALVHTLAHALFKSSLFMLIGVVDHQAGSRDIRRLGKLYHRMPFTFGSMVIGALSMAAVPPMMGFISKEGMLTAFQESELPTAATILLLVVAAVGALFTFTYSARIVLGGFVDGPRNMDHVKEAPLSLWLPAALPAVLSVPLAFAIPVLDRPVDAGVGALGFHEHTHLALWHGFTVPFWISLGVLILGVLGVLGRKKLITPLEGKKLFLFSGADALALLIKWASNVGKLFAKMADSFSPTRHLAYPIVTVIALGAAVFVGSLTSGGIDGVALQPRVANIDRTMDLLPLVIVAASVIGTIRAKTRLAAVVLVSAAGVGVTLQILMLGAPDVALTQFLVELLVIVFIMMVLRQQPSMFDAVPKGRQLWSGAIAIAAGLTAGFGVYALLGRHERPELAMWYLNEAPRIAGGSNIVNTILVEFRGLDTLGELSVLGMAGVVIASVIFSVPRSPFLPYTRRKPLGEEDLNSIPLRQLIRYLIPVLVVLSFLIFMRGHNTPGGGFIAALVASSAFMLSYLSRSDDRPVVPYNVPFLLTGFGVLTSLTAGYLGTLKGGFMYAIHGHIFGEHVTTSMLFDAGVFLAVLGMVTLGINALGGDARPGNEPERLPYRKAPDSPLAKTTESISDAEKEVAQ